MEEKQTQQAPAEGNCPQMNAQNMPAEAGTIPPAHPGTYPFRSAAFGGFARQDVLNYLKQAQQVHEQALLEQQTARIAAEAQAQEAALRVQSLLREQEDAQRRVKELAVQLAEAEQAALRQTAAMESLARRSAEQSDQIEELENVLQRLRPQAESYVNLKDRAAGIELSAHERAELALLQAKRESERVRARAIEWLKEVQGEYQELREDMSITFRKTTQELERIGRLFARVEEEFDGHEDALQHFLEQSEAEE